MAIGVFDSGVGGLSVYKRIKEKYENEKIIYFADFLNFPYGTKTKEELEVLVKHAIKVLKDLGASSIVIACNTASSVLNGDEDVIGMIEPVCSYINENNIKNVVLLATKATVESNVYDKFLKDRLSIKIKAPNLVEAIETRDNYKIKEAIDEYIKDLDKNKNIILACTHFPIALETFEKNYKDFNYIDPAIFVVNKLKVKSDKGKDVFYTSKDKDMFYNKIKQILGKEDIDVRLYKG